MVTRPSGVDLPPLPVNETLRLLRFENCWGFIGGVNIPREWVREDTPPAFDSGGFVPVVGNLVVEALHCERLVTPQAVIGDYRQLFFGSWTHTNNASWEPMDGPSWYLFDLFVSDDRVSQQYEEWGFPSRNASFVVDKLAVGDAKEWTVTSAGARIQFSYPISNDPIENERSYNYTYYEWTGEDPYLRATVQGGSTVMDGAKDGLIEFEGDSNMGRAVRTSTVQLSGAEIVRQDQIFTVDTDLFFGENT